MLDYDFTTRGLEHMILAGVNRVAMSVNTLVFDTDKGFFPFKVYGDCCSWSYFYDFHGVHKLLENGIIVAVEEVQLDPRDYTSRREYDDCLQVYGYRIVTQHPIWGEQSSVFSFRNESNGYYGGWMEPIVNQDWTEFFTLHELKEDVVTLD